MLTFGRVGALQTYLANNSVRYLNNQVRYLLKITHFNMRVTLLED